MEMRFNLLSDNREQDIMQYRYAYRDVIVSAVK
jgi:hypothetical protein